MLSPKAQCSDLPAPPFLDDTRVDNTRCAHDAQTAGRLPVIVERHARTRHLPRGTAVRRGCSHGAPGALWVQFADGAKQLLPVPSAGGRAIRTAGTRAARVR